MGKGGNLTFQWGVSGFVILALRLSYSLVTSNFWGWKAAHEHLHDFATNFLVQLEPLPEGPVLLDDSTGEAFGTFSQPSINQPLVEYPQQWSTVYPSISHQNTTNMMIYDDLPEIHDDLCWEWWLIVDLPIIKLFICHSFIVCLPEGLFRTMCLMLNDQGGKVPSS